MFGGAKSARNPSVMKHAFSRVPKAEIQRSTFDRSHGHKTTFDAGWLIPILVDEVVPGDTFKVNTTFIARLATPVFPIMDNMFLDTHFFAVPIRLIWDNFVKFNGEQVNPGDSTSYVKPVFTAYTAASGSLSDYMGIPTGTAANISHVSLWHRAYNLCWNTWYRDQNLQNSVVVDRDDGPDAIADYVLLRRGKRHDYFTAALPWPQKGTAVSTPLGGMAPVVTTGAFPQFTTSSVADRSLEFESGAPGNVGFTGAAAGATASAAFASVTGLQADLSLATASTINQLRQAFQTQKMLERDARGGTRYTEIIKSHFGVSSPDARLQRPEFLGGGSTMINISPIPQTSLTGATPLGTLAAMGMAVGSGHGFTMSFTEHCIIIGIASVRADLTYQQGLNRMFSKSTRFDDYWPALAHIGEQTVLRKEIYMTGTANDDNTVFGYQERYAEYRYKPSIITGLFRTNAAGALDAWHLAQNFSAPPTLSAAFIVEDPPIDRTIAVPTEPHFLFDSYFKMHCARPMPVFGVPGLIDHF